MSTTLLPPVVDLVVLRHELRSERLTEKMLAPVVLPRLPAVEVIYCADCGTPRAPRGQCKKCRKDRQRKSQRERRPIGSPGRMEAGLKRGAVALGISVKEYRAHRERGERWCSIDRRWESQDRFYRYPISKNGQRFSSACRAEFRKEMETA